MTTQSPNQRFKDYRSRVRSHAVWWPQASSLCSPDFHMKWLRSPLIHSNSSLPEIMLLKLKSFSCISYPTRAELIQFFIHGDFFEKKCKNWKLVCFWNTFGLHTYSSTRMYNTSPKIYCYQVWLQKLMTDIIYVCHPQGNVYGRLCLLTTR